LATHPIFRRAWALPPYSESEFTNPPQALLDTPFYAKMTDVEVVLRFFALRHANQYSRGMQGFLDVYMVRSRRFSSEDLTALETIYNETLALADGVFGELLFRPWDVEKSEWAPRAQLAFSDAVMVGLSRTLSLSNVLLQKRDQVVEATKKLFEAHANGTFTGRGNTKGDVNERIALFESMLKQVAGA